MDSGLWTVVIVDDEPLPRERLRTLLANHPDVKVVAECDDGASAVRSIETLRPDLVLLDVQMPAISGFEVLAAVDADVLPAVIFVTAFDEYATRAFDIEAVDYVLKPIVPERLLLAVERAVARLRGTSPAKNNLRAFAQRMERRAGFRTRFVARHRTTIVFVPVDDVDWIDAAANYVGVHARGRVHYVRSTMTALEAELDPRRFARVHRSIMVNTERIASLTPTTHGEYEMVMKDGARVKTSRSYGEAVRALMR